MRELPYDNEEGWDRNWIPETRPSDDDVRMLRERSRFTKRIWLPKTK